MSQPIFSICHTTARPLEWGKSYREWMVKAVDNRAVEYILCVDKRWGFTERYNDFQGIKVVWNTKRKCSVDGWNLAAQASTGKILILNSDDVFPPDRWDEELLGVIKGTLGSLKDTPVQAWAIGDFVIETKSNTPADDRRLMVVQIFSRARYEKQGYAFYPEYESVYADDDFTEHARQDGVVVDARHLVFEHRHPLVTGGALDAQYKHENSNWSYAKGQAILAKRRLSNFRNDSAVSGATPETAPKSIPEKKGNIVAVCTPGKEFPSDFVFEFGQLAVKLFCNGGYIHAPSKSCNIYTARSECLMAIQTTGIRPDYLFWVDSDQTGFVPALEQLYKTMEARRDIDILAGWTYMQHDANINCGHFQVEDNGLAVGPDGMFLTSNYNLRHRPEYEGEGPFQVTWIGFGCVLMRASVIDRLAPDIFSPIYVYKGQNHWVSEDTGFSLRALEKGIDMFVDPLAYVKHMKLQEVLPSKAMAVSLT